MQFNKLNVMQAVKNEEGFRRKLSSYKTIVTVFMLLPGSQAAHRFYLAADFFLHGWEIKSGSDLGAKLFMLAFLGEEQTHNSTQKP